MEEGIFLVPQIIQIFEDQAFSTKLNATERTAWNAFENFCRKFLGNEKAANDSRILQQLFYHTALWG